MNTQSLTLDPVDKAHVLLTDVSMLSAALETHLQRHLLVMQLSEKTPQGTKHLQEQMP